MNFTELKEWAEKHDIVQRTKDAFLVLLENYKKDDPLDYEKVIGNKDVNAMFFEVYRVSLNLGNYPRCDYNSVSADMRVWYNDEHIVNYKVFYEFNGDYKDDQVDFF